jgi:RimJ/RimL family protein N-acetyltransferase
MIVGDDLRLRAIERDDLSKFTAWLNDPEVRAGLLFHLPLSNTREEKWYEWVLKQPPEEHPMVIEVKIEGSWHMVGDIGFSSIDQRCRSAEVGILIGEKGYWNQGLGTRAMRLMLNHGFQTLNLNRVELEVYENNLRAIRSYEKVGFVHEGRKRQRMYKDGVYLDVLMMSVLRSEWKQGRRKAGA